MNLGLRAGAKQFTAQDLEGEIARHTEHRLRGDADDGPLQAMQEPVARNSQAGHPNCGAHSTVLILRPFAAAKGLEGCSLAAAGRPRPSRRPLRGLLEA